MRDLLVVAHGKLQRGSAGRRWARAEMRLREIFGNRFEIQFTSAREDATRLTRAALESGASWLAAAGGDGTIHEVVNGYFNGAMNLKPDAVLSFIPCGSGNDWVRTLSIPADAADAVTALQQSAIRPIDVGFAEFLASDGSEHARVFLNVAEAGVGGRMMARMNDGLSLRRTRIGYRLNTIANALTYRRSSLEVAVGGAVLSTGPALSLIVAGGQYFGAGMRCAPMARPDDGLLEVIIVGNFGGVELLWKIHRFFSGSYLTDPKITHLSARALEVCSTDRICLELDGEFAGILPAKFRILPAALAIRC
jgi:YegS/Rv2252/BmrU family lipid kinase